MGRALAAAVVALLAFEVSVAKAQSSPSSSAIDTKAHRNVCVVPYTALDNCGTDGTTDFSGYEPELFKAVASLLWNGGEAGSRAEWAPGNWSFTCFLDTSAGWFDLITALNNGTCDVGMGGITQDEVTNEPVVLSYSTYQQGRRIVILSGKSAALWVFLQPFSTAVWLLMFGSSVIVALVLTLLETPWASLGRSRLGADMNLPGRPPWRLVVLDAWQRYLNLQWAVTGLLLHGVFQLSPRTPGGRVVVLGTAFLALLLICMYTSAYAAMITTKNLKPQIKSMSDLTTLPVGIWEGDMSTFSSAFQLQDIVSLKWNDAEDEQYMLQLLRDHTIAALVIDAPFADYQTSVNCDLYEVGELVLPINMGYMYPIALSQSYAIHFDTALQTLQTQGVMQRLQQQFVRVQSSCRDRQIPGVLYTQIRLHDVGGLWIILACCIAFALLWNLLLWALPLGKARLASSKPPGSTLADGEPDAVTVISVTGAQTLLDSQAAGAQYSTLDEELLGVNRRLDKLDHFIEELPRALSAAMDERLTSLRAELAVVIKHQLSRRASNAGLREWRGVAYEGPGSGRIDTAHSTPRG